MTLYQVYNFLLGRRDADIVDLNYKKDWDILFKRKIISGDYSKMIFSALFTEIMSRVSI